MQFLEKKIVEKFVNVKKMRTFATQMRNKASHAPVA